MLTLIFFAASVTVQAAPLATPPLFTSADRAILSQRARKECGYATPQEIIRLARGERKKALSCLVRATVTAGSSLVPKLLEPGATILSISESDGLLVVTVQLAADHSRAIMKKDTSVNFGETLANRTCQDLWLGGLLDAGMDGDQQGGTIVLYQLKDIKGTIVRMDGVAQCFEKKQSK